MQLVARGPPARLSWPAELVVQPPSGSPDEVFGDRVHDLPDGVVDLATDDDGRVLVAGSLPDSEGFITRYVGGIADPTFGADGTALIDTR